MNQVLVSNRQTARKLNLRVVRRVADVLLCETFGESDAALAIHFVGPEEMARINQEFLSHHGATDVITFDYTNGRENSPLQGEIFICIDEAVRYSRRFRCTWQIETVRYLVHGLLHLNKFDDLTPAKRRVMKRAENRLLREVASRIPLSSICKISAKV